MFSSNFKFPDPRTADEEGIVCIGGDLTMDTLLHAYSIGMFPWFNEEDPIIWWCPDPRSVIIPKDIHISKSMKTLLNTNKFEVRFNTSFYDVIKGCRHAKRKGEPGTWLTDDMTIAYTDLYENGYALSVETFEGDTLVGGLYGVIIDKCFFGESMFSNVPNASKIALIKLAQKLTELEFKFIDCQIHNPHLESMGAKLIEREKFLTLLNEGINFDINQNEI